MKSYVLARKARYEVQDGEDLKPHPDMFGSSALFDTADKARKHRNRWVNPSQDYILRSIAKEWCLWLLCTNDIPRIVDEFKS